MVTQQYPSMFCNAPFSAAVMVSPYSDLTLTHALAYVQ